MEMEECLEMKIVPLEAKEYLENGEGLIDKIEEPVVKEEILLEKEITLNKERKILEKERRLAARNAAAEEKLRKKLEKERIMKEESEMRYKRLMNLLTKSEFYSHFLLEKIQREVTEPKRKRQQLCDDKENTYSGKRRRLQGGLHHQENGDDVCLIVSERQAKADVNENVVKDNNNQILRECQPRLFENGELRPYQLDGFTWLKVMFENGINGILADEMGLGKTVQCIAMICHLVEKEVVGPFLVVAPLSTLPNWILEFHRFAPKIPTVLYHGSENERKAMRHSILKPCPIEGLRKPICPVILTSYSIVLRDTKYLSNTLWRYLVIDEGHRIKNYKCQLFRNLCSFSTANRLLLTGTPLQNNLSELWSLLNFILPEIFDSLAAFESWFEVKDMMTEGADEKIVQQEKEKKIISIVHKILSPFLLRRVKADVELQIPAKKIVLVYTPIAPLQLAMYKATLTKDDSYFNDSKSEPTKYDSRGRPIRKSRNRGSYKYLCDDNDLDAYSQEFCDSFVMNDSKDVKKIEPVKKTMNLSLTWSNILMQCRKIVNHPYLVQYPVMEDGNLKVDENLIANCGKLQVLDQLLVELHTRGHKVLIFSQMAKMLNIIEDYLTLRPIFRYKRLDGSVKLEDRKQDIEEFNESDYFFLYLLTTRAGGLGINLTSADTVIIYDSDWNPQQDLQAQDRCHRIGQTKPVLILRLVTASTVDERMVETATAKRKLEKMIMKKGQFGSSILTKREIMNLTDPEELLALLQEREYQNIHRVLDDTGVFTKEELNQLLDRSDMVATHLKGIFKVIPENCDT